MTTRHVLSEQVWTRITDPGQNGTCWRSACAVGYIVIDHTESPQGDTVNVDSAEETAAGIDSNKGCAIKALDDPVFIPADSSADVYYALITGCASAIFVVDVS